MKIGGGSKFSQAMMMEAMSSMIDRETMVGMLELQQFIFNLSPENQKKVFAEMVQAGKIKAQQLSNGENVVEEIHL